MTIFNIAGFQRLLHHHAIANPCHIHFWPNHDAVDNFLTDVLLHQVQLVRQRQARRCRTQLTAQVTDIDHRGRGATQRLRQLFYQQNGHQAGIKTAWTDQDKIRFTNGLHRFSRGGHARIGHQLRWRQEELVNIHLAVNFMPFGIDCHQVNRLFRHGDQECIHLEQITD